MKIRLALVLALVSSLCQAQADTAVMRPPLYGYRDGGAATAFGFLVPGLGQIYAGRPVKGVGLLLISGGGIALASQQATKACENKFDCEPRPLVTPGFFIALAAWGVGVVTASRDVDDFNRKHFRGLDVEPGFREGRFNVSLTVRY